MLFPSLFSQADLFKPNAGSYVAFVLLTLAFLALSVAIIRFERAYDSRLTLLGVLVAMAGVGFGTMVSVPSAASLATVFLKIGVIMVLGGVGCSLLSFLRGSPAATGSAEPKEPSHDL